MSSRRWILPTLILLSVGLGLDPARATECNDTLDNDGDGATDLADSDCTDAADPFEGVGVLSLQKISDTQGYLSDPGSPGTNPGGLLADGDNLGESAGFLGDLDGDGTPDIAVGAPFDDDGATDAGAGYVLSLNPDGTVKARQKISNTEGGLGALLAAGDLFGLAAAHLGDLDRDGVDDLLLGAHGDDAEGTDAGAAYVLFLNSDGSVKLPVRLSDASTGDLSTLLSGGEFFGISATTAGDLDGDGVQDLVVGAHRDDSFAADAGAAYVFFMRTDGSAKGITQLLPSGLGANDRFGLSMTHLGDLDGDGQTEIAVGAPRDDDGGTDRGAVWILTLDATGAIAGETKISDTQGGFSGTLANVDNFGHGLARLGDLDGDGVADLAVGSAGDDDPASNTGAVWILFLNADGSVKSHRKLDANQAPLAAELDAGDQFGNWVTSPGDVDGDGISDLVSTARFDDDGGTDRGAAYVLFLDGQPAVCGDGVLDPLEECDDGGTTSGDGCSDTCELEPPKLFVAELTFEAQFLPSGMIRAIDNLPVSPSDPANVLVGVAGNDLRYLEIAGGLAGTDATLMASLGSGVVARTIQNGLLRGAISVAGTHGALVFDPWPTLYRGVGVGPEGIWVFLTGQTTTLFRFNPWTTGTAMAWNGTGATLGGVPLTPFSLGTVVSVTGFVHGPLSETSTAGQVGGVVQLVTPTQIASYFDYDPGPPVVNAYYWTGHVSRLTVRLVPEPRAFAMLAAGALLTLLLGRQRLRWKDGRKP